MDLTIIRCRCCLVIGYSEMRNLEDFWADDLKYGELLDYFMGDVLQVDVANYICYICESILIEAYKFKKKCLESQSLLIDIINNKTVEEYDEKYDDKIEILEIIVENTEDESVEDFQYDKISNDIELIELNKTKGEVCNEIEIIQVVESDGNNLEQEGTVTSDGDHIKCRKCDINFESRKLYAKHYRLVHRSKGERDCSKCNMKFESPIAYAQHYGWFHREKVVCPQCGKLIHPNRIRDHQQSHDKEKKYKCKECGKLFLHNNSLIKHFRVHTNDLRYVCQYCGKRFLHWNARRLHVINWHTGEKNYECTVCGMKFGHKSQMLEHIRNHTGERPHECEFCSKKFKTRRNLKGHLLSHSEEKNEKCEICGKAFKLRSTLKTHLKIHSGVRDYVCTICSKAFTQSHVLRTHMKTHPGIPPHPRGTSISSKKN